MLFSQKVPRAYSLPTDCCPVWRPEKETDIAKAQNLGYTPPKKRNTVGCLIHKEEMTQYIITLSALAPCKTKKNTSNIWYTSHSQKPLLFTSKKHLAPPGDTGSGGKQEKVFSLGHPHPYSPKRPLQRHLQSRRLLQPEAVKSQSEFFGGRKENQWKTRVPLLWVFGCFFLKNMQLSLAPLEAVDEASPKGTKHLDWTAPRHTQNLRLLFFFCCFLWRFLT